MKYRLLVAYEVVLFLESLNKAEQQKIRRRLLEITDSPDQLSDYQEPDCAGRMVDIHLCGKLAIKFWIDVADRDLKILDMHYADE